MTDFRSMFDRDYIGAWDIPRGRDTIVEIERVEARELTSPQAKKTKKPVAFFRGKLKGFVLNKTNAKAIARMYGTETEAWIGKLIAIYATTTEVGGETVECIRVRPYQPTPPQQQATLTEASSEPAAN